VGIVLAIIVAAVIVVVLAAIYRPTSQRKGSTMNEQAAPDPTAGPCPNCGGPLSSLGVERFRTGGTTGGWKMLFGEWAELGEQMLDLEVLGCRKCRRVEFRIPEH